MKTGRTFLFIFMGLIVTFIAKGQTASKAVISPEVSGWKPVKIDENGNNSFKGVDFYRKKEGCNSEDVIFFKMVNNNKYAVNVKWTAPDGSASQVVIKAASQVEGDCYSYLQKANNNLSSLSILKPVKKDEHLKQKMLAGLEVTEVKN